MRNTLVILVLCLGSFVNAVPLGLKKNMPIVQEQEDPMLMMAENEETRPEMMISRLNLPSNATSIRADITDGFSCDNKTYGYYADVENECQIFHVCLPVTYADGKENTFRWSFICPEETVFSQEYFTCMRSEDMSIDCVESFKYYELNRNFGMIEPEPEMPAEEPEEEMAMEDMSRQPPSQGQDEVNNQPIEAAPVKKQTVKVTNANRKKTQANRVSIEAQRKKVQPLRKLPKPADVVTTAKPIAEEAPILEQEVERTTLKYQRLTKRPIANIPEQPKPEEPKPEKEVIRHDLFAQQKRKRPQIYFPTRFDAAIQADTGSNLSPSLKTDIVLKKQPETIMQDQPEAQASEIKEVSIKPQVDLELLQAEKSEPLSIKEKEPVFVYVPTKEDQPGDMKSEIDSLPESTPSRVEIVEIPIEKLDEPLKAEGAAVLAKTPEVPMPEESKPIAEAMKPIEVKYDNIPTFVMKKLVPQAETVDELKKPIDAEKVLIESAPEGDVISLNEPEQLLKTVELPKTELVNNLETVTELKMPEESTLTDDIPLEKTDELPANSVPEVLLKTDTPTAEEVSMAKVEEAKPESENKQVLTALKTSNPTPVVPESVPEKLENLAEKSKPSYSEPEVPAAQPLIPAVEAVKPLEIETQILLKTDKPAVELVRPLEEEVSPSVPDMPMKADVPEPEVQPIVEIPADMLLNLEPESLKTPEKPVEEKKPSSDPKIEIPVEIVPKPVSSQSEPIKIESSEVQLEKSSEIQTQEENQESQLSAEKETNQSATDNEEAQSLILDFISSLVNSENSNFEEQSAIVNEMSADSLPEASIAEPVMVESEQSKIESQNDQINPVYIPMTPSNDQMYQIPVQVIETPEPEASELAVPSPVVAEPKLPPLSVDDVVELVKESLDTPAEKQNLVQETSNDDTSSQPESEEVKPIYHRYIELGSNLLKSEALTASDDEPVVVSKGNEESPMEKVLASPELPKTSEKLPKQEELTSKQNSLPEVQSVQTELNAADKIPAIPSVMEALKEGRSLNRFKMDPRKRRFLFRSDAS